MQNFIGTMLMLAATSSAANGAAVVVHTDASGGASTSAYVSTEINSTNNSSIVHVETSVNGVSHSETYASPGPIKVKVVASSTGYRATSTGREVVTPALQGVAQATATDTGAVPVRTKAAFFINIGAWFGHLWSWLRW